MNTFWTHPTARRYEQLVRSNIIHVGKVNGFKAIEDFFFAYAAGYTTLSHDNIDVLLSSRDNKLVIIEWSKHTPVIDSERRQEYKLDDYPLVMELALHFESLHK